MVGKIVGSIPAPSLDLQAAAIAEEQCNEFLVEEDRLRIWKRTRKVLHRLSPQEAASLVGSEHYDRIVEMCYDLRPMHDPHHEQLRGVEVMEAIGSIGREASRIYRR